MAYWSYVYSPSVLSVLRDLISRGSVPIADRLWIQRAPPKPPRPAKRKRPPSKPKRTTASSRRAVPEDSDDEDPPPPSAKRKRVQRQTRASTVHSDPPPSSSRSRAAKVQANKKLDAQAKELAEYQRQAAASAKTRSTRQKQASPQKQASVGTRSSARLRGSARDDDEWQEIPKEWLKASVSDVESEDGDDSTGVKEEDDDDAERGTGTTNGAPNIGGDESSDLTELSDSSEASDGDHGEQKPATLTNGSRKRGSRNTKDSKAREPPQQQTDAEEVAEVTGDFVEWELVCRCILSLTTSRSHPLTIGLPYIV